MNPSIFIAAVAAFAFALSGCGKANPPASASDGRREPIKGELLPLVQSFKGGPGFGPCEEMNYPAMLEIARELDERTSEIEAYASTRTNPGKSKPVKVGPITMRQLINPEVKSGWTSFKYGWGKIIADRKKIGADAAIDDWHWLNVDVRAILADDKWRVVHNDVPTASHLDEEVLGRLREIAASAKANRSIPMVKPTPEDRKWMLARSPFDMISRLMDSESSGSRDLIVSQLEYAIADVTRMGVLRKNVSIRRVGDEVVLPMHAGPFAEVTATISEYVESMWASAALRVRIEWLPASPEIYEMLVGSGSSSRPFVSWSNKTLTLSTDNRVTSIAHEFGHVLGFADRYYTRWEVAQCEYVEESHGDDLMSESITGRVLDADWKALDETYR